MQLVVVLCCVAGCSLVSAKSASPPNKPSSAQFFFDDEDAEQPTSSFPKPKSAAAAAAVPSIAAEQATQAPAHGDIVDVIHDVERQEEQIQQDNEALQMTLQEQSKLIQKAQQQAQFMGKAESELKKVGTEAQDQLKDQLQKTAEQAPDLERASPSAPQAAVPGTPPRFSPYNPWALPAPKVPAVNPYLFTYMQNWEKGQKSVSSDLEAEAGLMARAEELQKKLEKAQNLQNQLEMAIQETLKTQGQLDQAKRVINNFKHEEIDSLRSKPSKSEWPSMAWYGMGVNPTAAQGLHSSLQSLKAQHQQLIHADVEHVEKEQSLEKDIDSALDHLEGKSAPVLPMQMQMQMQMQMPMAPRYPAMPSGPMAWRYPMMQYPPAMQQY